MKKFLFLFLIFLVLSIPAASAKKMYAPDLSVSRVTLDNGGLTIKNTGNKNSPSSGFDVLIMLTYFDGTIYKNIVHFNSVIAPGHSQRFNESFPVSTTVKSALFRVNPYKKFQEWNYDDARYVKLINSKIVNYTATEQARYWGTVWDNYWWQWVPGWDYMNGNSTTIQNGAYTPIISNPNPIAQGWYKKSGRYNNPTKTWVNQTLYANAVNIIATFVNGPSRTNYVSVSGVPNNGYMHVFCQVGYNKTLTYNSTTGVWEAYVDYRSAKIKNSLNVTIYSERIGENGSADLASCSNITVKSAYVKNSWTW